jgi:hypothetical protein
MGTMVLECDLTQETCEERVRARTGDDRGLLAEFRSQEGILCLPTDDGFRLRVRKPMNRLAPRCFVRFKPVGGGTRIELRTRMHPYPAIFMFIWLSGIVGLGGYIFVASALTLCGVKAGIISPIAGVVAPPIMFAFAFLFVRNDRRGIRATQADVMSFLSRELGAHEGAAAQQRVAADGAAPRR